MWAIKQSLDNFLCNTGQATYVTASSITTLHIEKVWITLTFSFLKITVPTNYVWNLRVKTVIFFQRNNWQSTWKILKFRLLTEDEVVSGNEMK